MRLFQQAFKRFITSLGLCVTTTAVAAQAHAQTTPAVGGVYVLTRMHDAYAGKWYKTLTFTQKTTVHRPGAAPQVQTWLESLRSSAEKGTQLRIDMGDLSAGQGVLYTADSSWIVVGGKARAPRAEGNEFIPLIQSVYVQPVAQTDAELGRLGFNTARAHLSILEGKTVWVVGASSPTDTNVSTFAVDTARKVVMHVRIVRNGQSPVDASLGGYVRVGQAWLATKVEMSSRGHLVQTEAYSNWKIDPVLPASLFDIAQWSTAPHWGRRP